MIKPIKIKPWYLQFFDGLSWEMRLVKNGTKSIFWEGGTFFWAQYCKWMCCLFFSKAPLEETVGELRRELEQCLVSNKAKREQVHELEKELGTLKDQLKDQEIKAQRMERIAQEHEVELQCKLPLIVLVKFVTILQASWVTFFMLDLWYDCLSLHDFFTRINLKNWKRKFRNWRVTRQTQVLSGLS